MADSRRVDDLGRVVIPKGVRTILGIEEGDELDVQIAGDMVCYRKHKPNDVVEVVRCKDCKHWGESAVSKLHGSCDVDALLRHRDFFCAAGDMREVQDA